MNRRHFLKTGLQWGVGLWVFNPLLVLSQTSLDSGLQAQKLMTARNYSKAVELLKKAVQQDPENDWLLGMLGRALKGAGHSREAVKSFRAAVRLNPEDTYSKMMIDQMTQHPLPVPAKKPVKKQTPLEKQAAQEAELILKKLKTPQGLDYQVRRVVIDAGHGGFDPGAVSKGGLKEKDITLDLALRLDQMLKKQGRIKSFLTRTGDYYVPLSARTATANQHHADLFISLHINAFTKPSAHGSETYFCSQKASTKEAARVAASENAVLKYDQTARKSPGHIDIEAILFKFEQKNYWNESGRVAKIFQQGFKKELPLKSRGINSADFYVLRKSKMPSILLETGFISNPQDESKLKKDAFRQQIAQSVVKGLACV